jgi:hypothetical protein
MRIKAILITAFCVFSGVAHAGQGSFFCPRIEPASPAIDDEVSYLVGWDGCGSLETPTITQNGFRIDISQPTRNICGIPIGGGTVRYSLGRLRPGTYRVHLAPCAILSEADPLCVPLSTPEDVSFTVGHGAIADVPLGFASMLALCALIACAAYFQSRRDRLPRNCELP